MMMRQWINLCEDAAPRYLLHATPRANIRSIMAKGLLADRAGNYSDSRWVSLSGVYATDRPEKITEYIQAHDLGGKVAIVVIEVHPSVSHLPDEDLIDILLRHITELMASRRGIAYDQIPAEIEFDDPVWDQVAAEFHREAGGGPEDKPRLHELVEYWADFELYEGGDTNPDYWAELKDWATRQYPRLMHPTLKTQSSTRIVDAIGFKGATRIVAIVDFNAGQEKVVYGQVPSAEQALLDRID